jgi:hypothetical protein
MTTTRFSLKLRHLAALAFVVGVTSTGVSANTITMANYNGGAGTVDCTLSCLGFIDDPTMAAPNKKSLSSTDATDYTTANSDESTELAKLNALLGLLDPARSPVTFVDKTDAAGGGFTTDRQYFSIKQSTKIYYFENTSGGILTVALADANDYSHYTEYGPVSADPVPAAAWLFGTALIGFIGFSRRTKV